MLTKHRAIEEESKALNALIAMEDVNNSIK
jgi:hypothetical protein